MSRACACAIVFNRSVSLQRLQPVVLAGLVDDFQRALAELRQITRLRSAGGSGSD